ncbi:MAG: hypothetical protein K0S61_1682, partial [Anaerocolumna sp.]|nr:hypothetical protein [Anaerocolumna sp.]
GKSNTGSKLVDGKYVGKGNNSSDKTSLRNGGKNSRVGNSSTKSSNSAGRNQNSSNQNRNTSSRKKTGVR